jgi:hypothetical protein
MANRRNAQPNQIVSSEFRQYLGIDVVLRNAVTNCSRPRPRSQLVISIDITRESPVEASPPTAISPPGAHHGSLTGHRKQPGGHHVNSDCPQHYALNASGKEAINLGSISASGTKPTRRWPPAMSVD